MNKKEAAAPIDVTTLVSAINALAGQTFADKAALQIKVTELVGTLEVTATVNDKTAGGDATNDTTFEVVIAPKTAGTSLTGYTQAIELTVKIGANEVNIVKALCELDNHQDATIIAAFNKLNLEHTVSDTTVVSAKTTTSLL
ncbi:hypothetical protein [Mesoplasma melaleucae]|uniref:Uncharacterized protein n=1 Tax=Mesoplasma melaleucae TaxID=81459 RepID=A0A2K8NWD8_9MOLU|nr:hypothetical protein [Mesoplasma melaleucae]ATZ18150.1 hypothetical protein EMELA_v1c06430 [Mesoplasma melaleucae]